MSSQFEWKRPGNTIDALLRNIRKSPKDSVEAAWRELEIDPGKARVLTMRGKTLIIEVSCSAAMQEFWFRKEEILTKLNQRLGGAVMDIKLRLGGY